MKRRYCSEYALAFSVLTLSLAAAASGDPAPGAASDQVVIRAAQVLDVRAGTYINSGAVYVEDQRIKAVGPFAEVMKAVPAAVKVIDLGRSTVLPGHTHMMARFSSGPQGYELGLLTKSQAYRALEGAANARSTLEAGFTAVRDVENEGTGYADVALRDAINEGLVPGPRMRVATRGIAAVGQYPELGADQLLELWKRLRGYRGLVLVKLPDQLLADEVGCTQGRDDRTPLELELLIGAVTLFHLLSYRRIVRVAEGRLRQQGHAECLVALLHDTEHLNHVREAAPGIGIGVRAPGQIPVRGSQKRVNRRFADRFLGARRNVRGRREAFQLEVVRRAAATGLRLLARWSGGGTCAHAR
jgi:hypothetical protein